MASLDKERKIKMTNERQEQLKKMLFDKKKDVMAYRKLSIEDLIYLYRATDGGRLFYGVILEKLRSAYNWRESAETMEVRKCSAMERLSSVFPTPVGPIRTIRVSGMVFIKREGQTFNVRPR